MRRAFIFLAVIGLFVACGKDNPEPGKVTYTLSQARSAKRGVSYKFQYIPNEEIALLGPAVSWSYDWSNTPPSDEVQTLMGQHSMDWVPMIWNNNYSADNIRRWKQTHPEAKYILAYNEPNLTDQANMTPAQAAEKWPQVVALAKELGMKLVSPAMNYGTLEGYHDPYKWLDEFFEQPGVSIDDVDAIACHCYMGAAPAVMSFIDGFKKYGKPIWLTEFCCGTGSVSEANQLRYMCMTVAALEAEPAVERYAWFMPFGTFNTQWNDNLLVLNKSTKSFELTTLGKVFVNMSTCDKSIFYRAGEVIPAEQWAASSGTVLLAPSADGGVLDISDLSYGGRVDYQLDLKEAGTYSLTLRYACDGEAGVLFRSGSEEIARKKFPSTGGVWKTGSFEVTLPAGKSILSLEGTTAPGLMINWMKITK
ncbi:MAG: hypothetical protein J6W09_07805 [Bacteroidales bacterium]|nr:hypothetical protein [Bacteroidales bacterium]